MLQHGVPSQTERPRCKQHELIGACTILMHKVTGVVRATPFWEWQESNHPSNQYQFFLPLTIGAHEVMSGLEQVASFWEGSDDWLNEIILLDQNSGYC